MFDFRGDAPHVAPPDMSQVSSFLVRLLFEGERSAVILGAARLDVALERSLLSRMSECSGSSDSLFGPDRPLSSFSAKVSLAARLGVIDGEVERALHLVRRIRNQFAHSIDDESLSLDRHRDRLAAACEQASKTDMWKQLEPGVREAKASRELCDFTLLTAVLVSLLELDAYTCVEPRSTPFVRFSGGI